ncbi:DnaA regulatory inactivator Hda [uncultured Abyssibacter sp.]|uniref:HdaA/DnaA family protein n=1 Tax=uncultured Abyssibacter sp. TaxID=2320202 RepID=UPI0032B0FC5D
MNTPQLPLGLQLAEATEFASFVPGANAAVVDALRQGDQPLVLVGPPGSGKTHLLQAASRQPGRRAWLPMRQLIDHGPDMLDAFGGLDFVGLDDVDAVAGERDWELALLRLIDQARVESGRWVASLSRHPDAVEFATPDLRSRLRWAALHRLESLDETGLGALFEQRLAVRGLRCPASVTRYVLRRVSRSAPAVVALVEAIDVASLAAQREVTIPLVRDLLER